MQPTKEAKAAMYSMPNHDEFAYPAFGLCSGEAVRLDDTELGLARPSSCVA